MDQDRVKGKVDEVAGRAKRQVGEWTGDGETQTEGAGQEIKGKVQNAWGNVKDAVRGKDNDTADRDTDTDDRRKDVA
jgi:uncharacterized protein YjbJ (UPF0337 family)